MPQRMLKLVVAIFGFRVVLFMCYTIYKLWKINPALTNFFMFIAVVISVNHFLQEELDRW